MSAKKTSLNSLSRALQTYDLIPNSHKIRPSRIKTSPPIASLEIDTPLHQLLTFYALLLILYSHLPTSFPTQTADHPLPPTLERHAQLPAELVILFVDVAFLPLPYSELLLLPD